MVAHAPAAGIVGEDAIVAGHGACWRAAMRPACTGEVPAANRIARAPAAGWVAVIAGLVFGAAPAVAGPSSGVRVIEDTPARIVLEYRLGAYNQSVVRIEGRDHQRISLDDESLIKTPGAPELPRVCRSVIIPDDAAMSVTIRSSSYRDIPNVDVAPSKGFVFRDEDPVNLPYTFGDVYQTDSFYPGAVATLRQPYILRDWRGVVLEVNPFQYNPVKRLLRVYDEITVEVSPSGAGRVSVLNRSAAPNTIERAFRSLYRAHFVNYQTQGRYAPLDDTGELLILTYDAWILNVQPLADHKRSVGIPTTVVGMSAVGSSATDVASYIQSVYDDPERDLAFVLLVGDAAQVPTPLYGSYPADPMYALVAGDDSYPDIMVGRFSAETAGDVDTQVERTIEYEQTVATEQDWFWRASGVGSVEGPGNDAEFDYEHLENLRLHLLDAGYSQVDQFYGPVATAADLTAALNSGRGMVNYCGHGNPTGWSTTGFSSSHVDALTNDNMLPIIISLACNPGQFDVYTCFGESWLRATNGGEPTGAVGIYASSMGQYWYPPMEAHDEFVRLYTSGQYSTYGTLCFAGSCSMMDYYGLYGQAMFKTWIVFGDPSLCVVGTASAPSGMQVTPSAGWQPEGPEGGPFGPDSVAYTITNHQVDPIDFAVSSSAAWLDLSITGGTLPPGAQVQVTASINQGGSQLGPGRYRDAVQFTNNASHEGDTTRAVEFYVHVPPAPKLVFNLDTDPGWSRTGQWEFGPPAGQGGELHGYPDPTAGATGSNVFGYNLNGDYSLEPGGPYHLTSSALNCCGLTKVSLRYQRWLNTDYPPYVYSSFGVSRNGEHWLTWQNDGTGIADDAWSEHAYDISPIADRQPNVYVRWGHEVASAEAYPLSGWNIDDIEVWAVPVSPADYDADGDVDLFDYRVFSRCLSTPGAEIPPECQCMDLDGDGSVDLRDYAEFTATFTGG